MADEPAKPNPEQGGDAGEDDLGPPPERKAKTAAATKKATIVAMRLHITPRPSSRVPECGDAVAEPRIPSMLSQDTKPKISPPVMQVKSLRIKPAIECSYDSIGGGAHAPQH